MKYANLTKSTILAAVALASAVPALAAAPVQSSEAPASAVAQLPSDRMANRLGTFLGVGEPSPGFIGMNVAYNVTDYLRATVGYSHLSADLLGLSASTTTIGTGVKGFMPGWSLSPTVGLHYAYVSYSGDGIIQVGDFTKSGSNVYTSLGLDYQAKSGFNGGLGYNISFSGGGGSLFANVGWFFDWLN